MPKRYPKSPLSTWLAANDMTPHAFAARADVHYNTLYRILHRQKRSYAMDKMLKIEEATGGAVTARDMIGWINKGGRRGKKKQCGERGRDEAAPQ